MRRLSFIIPIVLSGLMAGCLSNGLPRPVITRDDQGRILDRSQFDRKGFLLEKTTYQYPDDSVSVEHSAVYQKTGARTESVVYHVWDTPISYKTVQAYDTNGVMQSERTILLPGKNF